MAAPKTKVLANPPFSHLHSPKSSSSQARDGLLWSFRACRLCFSVVFFFSLFLRLISVSLLVRVSRPLMVIFVSPLVGVLFSSLWELWGLVVLQVREDVIYLLHESLYPKIVARIAKTPVVKDAKS